MFVSTKTFSLGLDGRLQFRDGNVPAVARPPSVAVSIVVGVDKFEAIKLLRRLADEFEQQDEQIGTYSNSPRKMRGGELAAPRNRTRQGEAKRRKRLGEDRYGPRTRIPPKFSTETPKPRRTKTMNPTEEFKTLHDLILAALEAPEPQTTEEKATSIARLNDCVATFARLLNAARYTPQIICHAILDFGVVKTAALAGDEYAIGRLEHAIETLRSTKMGKTLPTEH